MEALELPVYRQIRGWSGHPMWYVYTLMGIYLFIPIIADLRYRYGSKKSYHIFALLFCVWAFLSMYADEGTVAWSIPLVFEFLGFVVLGSEIKYFMENREKSNAWAGLIIISGFLTYILEYILLYVHVGNGGEYYTRYLNSRVAPLSLLGAMLIFSGAVMLNIDLKFKLVAKYSFYIYLFHKWALDVLEIIFWKDDYVPDVRICIPLVVCMTLVLSLILSVMYLGAFKQLSKSLTENKQGLKGYGRH